MNVRRAVEMAIQIADAVAAATAAPAGRTGLSIGVVMFFGWAGMALGAWLGLGLVLAARKRRGAPLEL